MRKQQ
jgi:Ca2+-binding EF-hand superfamily protein